jgi:protein TonB
MRRDLIIGFIFSIAVEFFVGWGGNLSHYKPKPKVKEDDQKVVFVLPKLEPDEPDVVDDQPPTPQDIAPPQQQDVPQVVTPDSFVQQIEPPPPDLSALSKNIVKIPENRNSLVGIEVFDPSKLDTQPQPRLQANPQYPFEMRRAGISGDVRNAYAVHSSQREFEASAVQAVSKWKFKAGRKNGHAVFTHMQIPIVFSLNQGDQ